MKYESAKGLKIVLKKATYLNTQKFTELMDKQLDKGGYFSTQHFDNSLKFKFSYFYFYITNKIIRIKNKIIQILKEIVGIKKCEKIELLFNFKENLTIAK